MCTPAIGANTRYIISTSGRPASVARYKCLLQDVLGADVAYLPISSRDGGAIDAEAFCGALRGMNCIGGAISRDIKVKVMKHLDRIDPAAKEVGCVNTVLVEDGKLVGYNSDEYGFREAIKEGMRASGVDIKAAVVYGYGGVCACVCHVLRSMGIKVYITGRRQEMAESVAADLGVSAVPVGGAPDCQLLVCAAPVTDRPLDQADGLLRALSFGVKVVFDHELKGQCMRDHCRDHGLYHIAGTDMYYPQMNRQWGLFLKAAGLASEEEVPGLLRLAEEQSAGKRTQRAGGRACAEVSAALDQLKVALPALLAGVLVGAFARR